MTKDRSISLALFLTALIAYTRTLAPTLLQGDAALFQYTPHVLGVTYPTGYPVYIFLSKLWITLLPMGQIAWRMNLFSAVCASLTLPLFYAVARKVLNNRLAALVSVLLFATLPTWWRWATESKIYTLNILLYTLALYLATAGGNRQKKSQKRLYAAAFGLVLGLQLGVHSTTVLLLPGLLLLFWLNWRQGEAETRRGGEGGRQQTANHSPFTIHHSPFTIPLLLFTLAASAYLYIPLRAEWLIARYGRAIAIQRGLLADFYQSGLAGWIRYFTASDFTGGVVANWGKVPQQLVSVYLLQLLPTDFRAATWLILAMGVVGAALFLLPKQRRYRPLLLLYALPIPFVLTYGQGEQNAFLLTSNLIFSLFVGASFGWLFTKTPNRTSKIVNLLIFALFLIIPYRHAQYNFNWLTHKWNTVQYDYWSDVLHHPLEEEAGMMANWGDLTSMWYMQHVENRRPDLLGVYPADESTAADWLAQDRTLYIAAGRVMDAWQPGVMDRYQLIPWGRLVKLAPPNSDPLALLPNLSQPQNAVFDNKVRLLSADFPTTVDSGDVLYVNLAWQALDDLPELSRYSLRLLREDGDVIAQKDDTLRSGWFPLDYLPAGQPFVGAYPLQIPPGTLPGSYRLQLAVYQKARHEWPLEDGSPALDLGVVEVKFAPASSPPGANRFNGEISLDAYNFKVKRVGQGKGFPLRLLWRALKTPADNYTLQVELIDRDAQVWRDWQIPVETTAWQPEQQVRQQIDLTVPAEAPVGEDALSLRLSWLRADGSYLPLRYWIFPRGNSLTLDGPIITPKKNRSFEKPSPQTDAAINFENKAALIGYNLPVSFQRSAVSGQQPAVNPSALTLTLYWQGLGEMRHSYSVFVHLVDNAGNVVAQQDAAPGKGGKQPTTSWAIGEYITDPVEIPLPPDLPSGEYSVVVGLYLPPNGPRLLRLDNAGHPLDDSVTLGKIVNSEQ